MLQALSASLKIEIPDSTSIVAGEGLRPSRIKGAIVIEDVVFSYPQRPEHMVLRDLTLRIRPNTFVALVGASGGGKSTCSEIFFHKKFVECSSGTDCVVLICLAKGTLSALLERFYDPDEGSILLDGRDLRGLDPRWIRQQIGYVEQSPAMFAGTIKENILYGRPNATDAEVERAAQQANVSIGGDSL